MKTVCQVCMHHCLLGEGETGRCRGRKNESGVIVPQNYGAVTALALDPIEKKPLHRFFPGSMILSAGSYGCNLSCPFCQNHELSMKGKEEARTVSFSPEELVQKAEELKVHGNIGIAFTYNEPLIGFEFVRDTGKLAKEVGLKTAVVTNGSVTKETADQVLPFVDAFNIDLKGFTEDYYGFLGGDLETVKTFIVQAAASCHVELTTLIVPGYNDSEEEMRKLSGWVAEINPDIPLHVGRFFPRWKMNEGEPTAVEQVYRLAEVARENLRYVYTGNC